MAIGGAFLGGGVEVVPAGSCKLELEILTEDRANLTATFIIKGTSTYTVTAGADGRAVYTVPAGQTYTVSVNATGYDNLASQTVIAESGTVRYVRFEAIAGRVKRSGDTMTGTLAFAGGVSIDTNGQVIGKKLRATADIHLGSSPSSYAVVNDGWIQNRTREETKSDLGITGKQDQLTAGTNITIDGTTISAKDTTYDVATQSANGLMSSTDKTKLDGVDSALAGKVSKSGDTMTGLLKMEGNSIWLKSAHPIELKSNWTWMEGLEIRDVNEKRTGDFRTIRFNDGTDYGSALEMIAINPSSNEGSIAIVKLDDGTSYGLVPSWKPGTNDNSSKILTIKMANSLPSLVHTTGNENIAGLKTFVNDIALYSPTPHILVRDTNSDVSVAPSSLATPFYIQSLDKNGTVMGNVVSFYHDQYDNLIFKFGDEGRTWTGGVSVVHPKAGGSFATAPTTPSGASGTEIVTANWAISKFQRKITYGTGDPPSGGQAGDIYIQI